MKKLESSFTISIGFVLTLFRMDLLRYKHRIYGWSSRISIENPKYSIENPICHWITSTENVVNQRIYSNRKRHQQEYNLGNFKTSKWTKPIQNCWKINDCSLGSGWRERPTAFLKRATRFYSIASKTWIRIETGKHTFPSQCTQRFWINDAHSVNQANVFTVPKFNRSETRWLPFYLSVANNPVWLKSIFRLKLDMKKGS